ncbi:MAG TPA: hypothetical protein DD670_17600, partial [Planctomycetaceae bacterium]|nr:hypothetical protein [Planctomycetaceae bacterium]
DHRRDVAQPALPRRPMKDDADLDITPMIDCVFLLLIFFIVSSKMDQNTAVTLPPAKYGGGVSDKTAFIITVAPKEGDLPATVYLGDGAVGSPLPDDVEKQQAMIIEAVQEAFLKGEKSTVLIKAGVGVRHKYVSQVAVAIGKAEIDASTNLYIGVLEKN